MRNSVTSDCADSVTIRISKCYRIQVYSLMSLSSQNDLDNFYDDFHTTLNTNRTQYTSNIIMVDFNEKLGAAVKTALTSLDTEKEVKGDNLIHFVVPNGVKIMNLK